MPVTSPSAITSTSSIDGTDFVDRVAETRRNFLLVSMVGKYIINLYVLLKWVQRAVARREALKRVIPTLIDQPLDRKDILAESRDPDTREPLETAELEIEAWSNITLPLAAIRPPPL